MAYLPVGDVVKQIQALLHEAQDGVAGSRTKSAISLLFSLPPDSPWPPGAVAVSTPDSGFHQVEASSFADSADVTAFRQCKAHGGTDVYCFGRGDNGVGFTGLDCSKGSGMACALPPEDWLAKWGSAEAAAGKRVRVRILGREQIVELKDTMPHKANIKNGAGIDLNPDTVAAFGLKPPLMIAAEWQWVDE